MSFVVLLDELILLVQILIHHIHLEVLVVDKSKESNDEGDHCNLCNLFLEMSHLLRSPLVHDDSLSNASLSISVLFENWLEYLQLNLSLPESKST